MIAAQRLRRLLGAVASHLGGRLRLAAVRLAGDHDYGHVVISDGWVAWYPDPEPADWPTLLAKGATVIPCG